jgi:hypothetical protein
MKPDIAVVSSPSAQSLTSTLAVGINANTQGFYGSCNYPSAGQAIQLCSPTETGPGPVTFAASANSFGQMRKMELWVDGNKLGEDHWIWGQAAISTHRVRFCRLEHTTARSSPPTSTTLFSATTSPSPWATHRNACADCGGHRPQPRALPPQSSIQNNKQTRTTPATIQHSKQTMNPRHVRHNPAFKSNKQTRTAPTIQHSKQTTNPRHARHRHRPF